MLSLQLCIFSPHKLKQKRGKLSHWMCVVFCLGQPVLLVVTEFLVFGLMVGWHVFCPWSRDRDGVGVEMNTPNQGFLAPIF